MNFQKVGSSNSLASASSSCCGSGTGDVSSPIHFVASEGDRGTNRPSIDRDSQTDDLQKWEGRLVQRWLNRYFFLSFKHWSSDMM